ncbi:MAG: peptide chain release factor N(5)-glutamine methyltransferase [Phycisphaerae bacterium]
MADPTDTPWTVLKLLEWTRNHFERHEVVDPRLSAEVLLAHVLECPRIQLYARYNYEPTEAQKAAYRELVKRAAAHEPVAYLTGSKEFYSLSFEVNPDVLIPRPETEIVVEQALMYLKTLERPTTAWDCCTGSGCIGVAIAKHVPEVELLATDISEPAVETAARNAQANGVGDRVRCRVSDMLTLPADCADLSPFDVITANPPYVAEGEWVARCVEHEPKVALYATDKGMSMLRRLLAEAPEQLSPGGMLITEFSFNQADAVRDLIDADDRYDDATFLCDHQGIERTAVVTRA